jgi:restriction system protein
MECPGPKCAMALLQWLQTQSGAERHAIPQKLLWSSTPYSEESPTIDSMDELEGAFEHLEYAVFKRFENGLTRAERARLDNTIRNAMFKAERFLATLAEEIRIPAEGRFGAIRERVHEERERVERQRALARRADLKLAQLTSLTPEGFEEFVAELFEAMGYEVDRVGGSGDEGADLKLQREGLRAVVQCKYLAKSVVGSPDLQKFLGTIHHTSSHKGFFVTTSTFSLAAERFTTEHPIELIDGPRLVELLHQVLQPTNNRSGQPAWF